MIRKANEYEFMKKNVAGGNGELEYHCKFSQEELYGKCRLCAEIYLEPGQSVGMHPHDIEYELLYMLQGELVSVNDDGSEEPFVPGDMMITGGGEKHCLRNDGAVRAMMLAIVVN